MNISVIILPYFVIILPDNLNPRFLARSETSLRAPGQPWPPLTVTLIEVAGEFVWPGLTKQTFDLQTWWRSRRRACGREYFIFQQARDQVILGQTKLGNGNGKWPCTELATRTFNELLIADPIGVNLGVGLLLANASFCPRLSSSRLHQPRWLHTLGPPGSEHCSSAVNTTSLVATQVKNCFFSCPRSSMYYPTYLPMQLDSESFRPNLPSWPTWPTYPPIW